MVIKKRLKLTRNLVFFYIRNYRCLLAETRNPGKQKRTTWSLIRSTRKRCWKHNNKWLQSTTQLNYNQHLDECNEYELLTMVTTSVLERKIKIDHLLRLTRCLATPSCRRSPLFPNDTPRSILEKDKKTEAQTCAYSRILIVNPSAKNDILYQLYILHCMQSMFLCS